MNDSYALIAIGCSVLTLVILCVEKIFGGGNALAAKFYTLDKEMTAAVALVRFDMGRRIDEYENNSGVGFDTVRSSITEMQMALLKFRAEIAESLHAYIRKDDYNAGINEVKRDVAAGFRSVDDRLGQLQDLIMWERPADARNQKKAP